MIRVGLVGIGFMGWIHHLAYQRSPSAKLVAFASRDAKKRSGDWRGIQGNFGPPSDRIDTTHVRAYASLEELIADEDVDVVDICLPPNLHAQAAIAALSAGKHVLCEKPFALSSSEADQVLAAAAKHQRLVMVAQVLPYISPFEFAAQCVASGEYGRPIGGFFKRTISNPDWIPDFFNPSTVGGPLIDLNVHDAHFIRLLFGQPKRVTASGRMAPSYQGASPTAKYAHVCYEFDDPMISVASTGGVIDGPGRPFTHGFELHLERATLQFEFAAFSDGLETMPLKIVTHDGQVIRPTLASGDDVTAFEHEIRDMVTSIESKAVAPRLDPIVARDAIQLAECIQRSVVERRSIDVVNPSA